jgi:hypothetical protein
MPSLPMSPAEDRSLEAVWPWEKRACFSAGLGCPSFGGQRTVGGRSSLLLAGLVTCRRSSLLAKRSRSHAALAFQPRLAWHESLPFHACCAWPTNQEQHCRGRPNLKHQMPEVSTRRRCAARASSQSPSTVAVSRCCHLLAQPRSPNHSIKRTRLRQAAYVER